MLFLVVLLFSVVPLASSQFFNPTQSMESWRIGETKTIGYNTKFTRYTIALWQQALAGGAANLGPIVFQTSEGPAKNFDWQVQTYEFDLTSSNIFFFWLFEGDPFAQGNQSAPQMSSAFFNIADGPIPSDSTVPKPVTRTETSTNIHISTTQLSLPTTSAVLQPTQGTTEGGERSAGTNPSTRPSGSNDSDNFGPSGGLSVGAQAGIGVGVGVVAITSVVCGIIWCRYLRKKQKALEEWQGLALSQREPHVCHHGNSLAHSAPQAYSETKGNYRHAGPVEIG